MAEAIYHLTKPVRVGFIGAGIIGHNHMTNMTEIEGAQVVALCDVVRETAEKANQEYGFGANIYTDYNEMLSKEQLDACYICVPPFAHGDVEKAVIDAGVNMFVEKPLSVTIDTALQINKLVKKSKILTSVGQNWRYLESSDKAKEILQDKTIGMVMGYWLGGLPGVAWWRVRSKSGGQIVEQAIHVIDYARYFAGDVDEVYAACALRSMQDVPNLDVDDVGTATLRFENGAVGSISTSCILPRGHSKIEMSIYCRDLSLDILGGGNLIVHTPGNQETLEFEGARAPYRREDYIFLQGIIDGDGSKIRATYEEALKSHAVACAISMSAAERRPIKIRELIGNL